MSLRKTEAIILKTHNWSESSRTVVFFASDFGRIALTDKGGRSLKSKRGRLMPFARMELTLYHSERESAGYLREVELIEAFSLEKEGALGRLAYASAACELLNLLLPEEEPQRQLYSYFVSFLEHLDTAGKRFLPSLFVAFYLRLLSHLGYHPSLAYCVSCGKDVNQFGKSASRLFAPERGGVVCQVCQTPGDRYISFSHESYQPFLVLQAASLNEAAALPIGLKKATRILDALTSFVSSQTGLKSDLKSLEFVEKLRNSQLTE